LACPIQGHASSDEIIETWSVGVLVS
jgi:hypothetical protein